MAKSDWDLHHLAEVCVYFVFRHRLLSSFRGMAAGAYSESKFWPSQMPSSLEPVREHEGKTLESCALSPGSARLPTPAHRAQAKLTWLSQRFFQKAAAPQEPSTPPQCWGSWVSLWVQLALECFRQRIAHSLATIVCGGEWTAHWRCLANAHYLLRAPPSKTLQKGCALQWLTLQSIPLTFSSQFP